MSKILRVVLDTNIIFAGLYSAEGASFQVLRAMEEGKIKPVLSTPLLFEYEEILRRNQSVLALTDQEIEIFLDNFCLRSAHHKIYYLWRPCLPDPKDDHLLELAVASRVRWIVSHNVKDFKGAEAFGVQILSPQKVLEKFI
jgi:putative PIN family toxin of toxin-antitoxin system